jgi:hypothetical protein
MTKVPPYTGVWPAGGFPWGQSSTLTGTEAGAAAEVEAAVVVAPAAEVVAGLETAVVEPVVAEVAAVGVAGAELQLTRRQILTRRLTRMPATFFMTLLL